jgi:CRP/FNR family transcriptional regulator
MYEFKGSETQEQMQGIRKPDTRNAELTSAKTETINGRWKSKVRQFKPRDIVYHQSDEVHSVYLIRKGLVKLISYLPNGRARIVRLHANNHWLGTEGLLDPTYEHTAIAANDVEVEQFSIHNTKSVIRDTPEMLDQLLKQWHGDLSQADLWISDFSTGGIKARLARFLGYLAQLEFGCSGDRVELLSVQEISEILGVTPESVSRILASFKRNEILRKQVNSHPETFWIDVDRLQQVANE